MFNRVSHAKLSLAQLRQLDSFLTAPHEEATPMGLTQAHGFMVAVMSAPHLIMPSRWQPVLLGGHPDFHSMEQAQEIIGLITQFGNQANRQARGEEPLELLLWQEGNLVMLSDAPETLVAEWCQGYLKGSRLDPIWSTDEYSIALLLPFGVLAGQFELKGTQDLNGELITDDTVFKQKFRNELPSYVAKNFKHWSVVRRQSLPLYEEDQTPPMRTHEKIGRNEPCPCGSGKKHKKCCLEIAVTMH